MGENYTLVVGAERGSRPALWDCKFNPGKDDFDLSWYIDGLDCDLVRDAGYYVYGFCQCHNVPTGIGILANDYSAEWLGAPPRYSMSFKTADLCKTFDLFKENPKHLYGFFDQLRVAVQKWFPGVMVHDPVVIIHEKSKEAED